jgi:hypothetical protein
MKKGGLDLLTLGFNLVVAVTAIYWSAFTRFKWYFGLFTALSTSYREHLAAGFCIGAYTLSSSCLAASWAPLRFIGVTFRLEEFLFGGIKRESGATFDTLELLVFESHQRTSSLKYWLEVVI